MFEINSKKNRISKLEERTFLELKIKERQNLQEWIANTPDSLGEELLIIQKEFQGFDETRERLDLLALDKNHDLVIIENKLDDSGRDVVWQALKYVAYCSSLKKAQIIQIFQDYLHKQNRNGDASDLICEFLEVDTIDEVSLNSGSNQRFILVSGNFRKEVTSTVLWLISNGISAQCMKVTPFTLNDNQLLQITQIIPPPEAKDYMIGMSSKDSEEKETKVVLHKREQIRLQFWEQLLEHFRRQNFDLYQNVNPTRYSWLGAGSGIGVCSYTLSFGKTEARVEFNLSHSRKRYNKRVFDFLLKHRGEIESRFGKSLVWERLEDKKSSYIRYSKPFDGYNEESWPEMTAWLLEHIRRLEDAFKPIIPKIPR